MGHRRPRSAHNPCRIGTIPGYAMFEAIASQPLEHRAHEALLVARDLTWQWEPCVWNVMGYWVCPEMPEGEWFVVGWRYRDGSWPTGDPHAIDVARTDFERCPRPRKSHPSGNN